MNRRTFLTSVVAGLAAVGLVRPRRAKAAETNGKWWVDTYLWQEGLDGRTVLDSRRYAVYSVVGFDPTGMPILGEKYHGRSYAQ